mmetsp:Transcript_171865/g.550785  ORF Transcript_171865/g.550785 Transcript_171865/m.550785 type:complete len:490 (-) Transcript_171865:213-1682(-)
MAHVPRNLSGGTDMAAVSMTPSDSASDKRGEARYPHPAEYAHCPQPPIGPIAPGGPGHHKYYYADLMPHIYSYHPVVSEGPPSGSDEELWRTICDRSIRYYGDWYPQVEGGHFMPGGGGGAEEVQHQREDYEYIENSFMPALPMLGVPLGSPLQRPLNAVFSLGNLASASIAQMSSGAGSGGTPPEAPFGGEDARVGPSSGGAVGSSAAPGGGGGEGGAGAPKYVSFKDIDRRHLEETFRLPSPRVGQVLPRGGRMLLARLGRYAPAWVRGCSGDLEDPVSPSSSVGFRCADNFGSLPGGAARSGASASRVPPAAEGQQEGPAEPWEPWVGQWALRIMAAGCLTLCGYECLPRGPGTRRCPQCCRLVDRSERRDVGVNTSPLKPQGLKMHSGLAEMHGGLSESEGRVRPLTSPNTSLQSPPTPTSTTGPWRMTGATLGSAGSGSGIFAPELISRAGSVSWAATGGLGDEERTTPFYAPEQAEKVDSGLF